MAGEESRERHTHTCYGGRDNVCAYVQYGVRVPLRTLCVDVCYSTLLRVTATLGCASVGSMESEIGAYLLFLSFVRDR